MFALKKEGKMNGIQLSLFDFVDTPDFIEFCLLKGTGFKNGKKRILDYVKKNENMEDFPKFVSKELSIQPGASLIR